MLMEHMQHTLASTCSNIVLSNGMIWLWRNFISCGQDHLITHSHCFKYNLRLFYVHQMDVQSMFLNKEIFMQQPLGYVIFG